MAEQVRTTVVTSERTLFQHLLELFRHRELLEALVTRDVRSRYAQTALGLSWALLNPVAQMLVFSVVFSQIVQLPTGGTPYPIVAYVGILPWSLFAAAVTSSTNSLVIHYSLITKVAFPREVLPLSTVLARAVDFFIACSVLGVMMAVYGVGVSSLILLAIPILLVQLLFTAGVCMLLSAVNLFYRDVYHVMGLILLVWMYGTPVVYPENLVPESIRVLVMLNPMAAFISAYRAVVIDGRLPDINLLGLATIESLVVLVVAFALFKKWEPLFADMI